MLDVKEPDEEVLAITRLQSKKAVYPDPHTEERLREAKADVEQAMAEERRASHNTASTPLRSESEKTIIKQMLQTIVPVWMSDLLQMMPQLKMAVTNIVGDNIANKEHRQLAAKPVATTKLPDTSAIDPMLLTVCIGRKPAMVEMEIMGQKLMNTIVDDDSRVNVLPEETWRGLGKPILLPPTFQLVGADQHGIKPLETLMAQKVVIDTQHFFLDFIVIPLEKKAYDALLGRGWLIMAKTNHNWKKNTLSIKSEGHKYVIDLRNQAVSEELASSDLEFEGGELGMNEGRKDMEPNNEGLLELEHCSDDEMSSLNRLFHWQMEDYEVFHPGYNMLEIREIEEVGEDTEEVPVAEGVIWEDTPTVDGVVRENASMGKGVVRQVTTTTEGVVRQITLAAKGVVWQFTTTVEGVVRHITPTTEGLV